MAAVDYFLKIDGIEGESKDSKHGGEIDVLSWSGGHSQGGSFSGGGGGGSGKVAMQDFHFTMHMNKASPKLADACATGKHIPKAVLTCRKAGDKPLEYLIITMSDVLVSSYQHGGSSSSEILPTDQISLNFAKIEWAYSEQKADGTGHPAVKKGFDLKKMVAT